MFNSFSLNCSYSKCNRSQLSTGVSLISLFSILLFWVYVLWAFNYQWFLSFCCHTRPVCLLPPSILALINNRSSLVQQWFMLGSVSCNSFPLCIILNWSFGMWVILLITSNSSWPVVHCFILCTKVFLNPTISTCMLSFSAMFFSMYLFPCSFVVYFSFHFCC